MLVDAYHGRFLLHLAPLRRGFFFVRGRARKAARHERPRVATVWRSSTSVITGAKKPSRTGALLWAAIPR